MARGVLLAVALVAACAQGPGASVSTAATPSPSICTLPVIQGSPGQGSGPQTPGFLTIPGGQFTAAVGAGDSALSFDHALHRWVPATEQSLTPDGLRYIYAEHAGTLSTFHVVDLSTGNDRAFGPTGQWVAAGLDNTALYAMRVDLVESPAYGTVEISKGLWSIPLDGSVPTQLTSDSRRWAWVSAGGVYGDSPTGNIAGAPNDIARLDSATGQVSVWFDQHARSTIIAVDDQGAAFVLTESADEELWRVTGPNVASKIWSGPTSAVRPDGDVAAAGSDVWFSGSSLSPLWAVFHYSTALGLEQVATFTDRPVTVAGTCT